MVWMAIEEFSRIGHAKSKCCPFTVADIAFLAREDAISVATSAAVIPASYLRIEPSGSVRDIIAIYGSPRQFGAHGTPDCGYFIRVLFAAFDFDCQPTQILVLIVSRFIAELPFLIITDVRFNKSCYKLFN
ncbi:Uncharacterised protein [marine metagenome]